MKRLTLTLCASACPAIVWAHEGHGMPGAAHWHASDAWGFALAVGVVAVMIWWGGRGR